MENSTNQIQPTVNFMSSKDNDEERVMHSKSDNIEIMVNNKVDEVIEELFSDMKISDWVRNVNEKW